MRCLLRIPRCSRSVRSFARQPTARCAPPDTRRPCVRPRPDRCGSAGDGRGHRGRTSRRPAPGRRSECAACFASRAVQGRSAVSRGSQPQGVLHRIRDALVYGLAPIDAVLQEMVEGTAAERAAALRPAGDQNALLASHPRCSRSVRSFARQPTARCAHPDTRRPCVRPRPDRCGSAGDGRGHRGRTSRRPAPGRRSECAACFGSRAVQGRSAVSRGSQPQGIGGKPGERGRPPVH